jgi:hypothetical protein
MCRLAELRLRLRDHNAASDALKYAAANWSTWRFVRGPLNLKVNWGASFAPAESMCPHCAGVDLCQAHMHCVLLQESLVT